MGGQWFVIKIVRVIPCKIAQFCEWGKEFSSTLEDLGRRPSNKARCSVLHGSATSSNVIRQPQVPIALPRSVGPGLEASVLRAMICKHINNNGFEYCTGCENISSAPYLHRA